MGGTSTYGYETRDGKIHYCIYRDYILLEEIIEIFQHGKVYQIQVEDGELITANSLEDYFNEERYRLEDSKVRGVCRLDGTLMYKIWGVPGTYTYTFK